MHGNATSLPEAIARPGQAFVICGAGLCMILLVWRLWPTSEYRPFIRLPAGRTLDQVLQNGQFAIPKGWHTNIYCRGRKPALNLNLTDRTRLFFEGVRGQVHECLGTTLWQGPSQRIVETLTPRLGECFQASGEIYLVAKEFGWEVDKPVEQGSDFIYLCFVFGGTNQLRHARDWVTVVEEGIARDGLLGRRLQWSLPNHRGKMTAEFLSTNQCAVIHDTPGLVKIVPLDCLRAYGEAGLVNLSSKTEIVYVRRD